VYAGRGGGLHTNSENFLFFQLSDLSSGEYHSRLQYCNFPDAKIGKVSTLFPERSQLNEDTR